MRRPVAGAEFPRRFGERYVLLKELGQGGMGQVFLAMAGQAGVERVCAMKILRDLAGDRDADEMGRRFLDEAKIVTRLSHENLVYVFDFGLVRSRGYLAMEYVAGKTLTETWNRCAARGVAFPFGVSLLLVSELTAGLGYAHRLGGLDLVHRDVSPSNVMLSYTGGVKLIDFGLAKWKSKLAETATGINWGKLSYMSPEQHQGRPVGHQSDLFSAGVILWELLTGRQLFPSGKDRPMAPDIQRPSAVNPTIPPALDEVIMRALAPEPALRFASGEEMSAAIAGHMPRETSKPQVAAFLRLLFEADEKGETLDQEELLVSARTLAAPTPISRAAVAGRPAPTALIPGGPLPEGASGDTDPLVGATLADRYYVRRRVGEGAMGRVYEGHHTGIGKRVAIKVPRNSERRKSELMQRFRLEASAASRIGHPNIADVTDCGTTPGGDFFFVMEFLDGVDLAKLVRRDGALPVERALLIALQICRALEAAHKAGIIHRDIKPSNVMVLRDRDEDLVKVLDFGVAKFLRVDVAGGPDKPAALDLTQADAAVGTPRYMAPEQMESGRNVDFRADIYGLGGALYFMLSGGHAPIEADSIENVWRKKISEDPTPLSKWRADAPPEVDDIVMRCLARDPARRPPSMEALKQDLLLALERARAAGSSIMPMRVPSSTVVVAPAHQADARRAKLMVAGAAAVGFALIAAAAGYSATRRGGSRFVSAPAAALADRASPPAAATLRAPPIAHEPLGVPPATTPPVATAAPTTPAVPVATTAALPAPVAVAPAPAPAAAPSAKDPAESRLLLDKARRAFQFGKFVEAQLLAEKALKSGAGARAHILLAQIRFATDDLEESIAAYDKALQLEPENGLARRGRDLVERRLADSQR